jgi:hypothetical protein
MLSRVVSSPIHGNCSRGICLITSGNVGPPGRAPSRISRSLMRSTPEISLVGVSPPLMTQGRNLRLGGCCFWDADLPNIGIGHSVFGVFVVVSISRYKNILLPVGEEGLLLPAAAGWRGSGPALDARERCRTDRGRGQRRAGAAPLVTSRVPNYALACA